MKIEIGREGSGRPILFLHGAPGLLGCDEFLIRLGRHGAVIAPSHPGFGLSELPGHVTTIGDLAFFYIDLMDQLDLRDTVVVASSIGGWIALEMAAYVTARMSHLILLDPVGVKFAKRNERDITDIYAHPQSEIDARSFFDPSRGRIAADILADDELHMIARNRQSTALFCWSPYMHNPKLRMRLHRVRVPTLMLWGAADRIVTPDYGRSYTALIPGARFETIERAGHYPHVERPDAVVESIASFIGGSAGASVQQKATEVVS